MVAHWGGGGGELFNVFACQKITSHGPLLQASPNKTWRVYKKKNPKQIHEAGAKRGKTHVSKSWSVLALLPIV